MKPAIGADLHCQPATRSFWEKAMKRLMLVLALMSISFVATAADVSLDAVVEADAATEFDAEKVISNQQAEIDLWNHLQASRTDGERARIRLTLGELDKALLANGGDGGDQGYLVGIHTPVGQAIDLGREAELGKVSAVGRELVWNTSVQSGDANALRIHFTDVDLPKGAALYVYNDAGQAHGPYTGKGPHGDGDFWSHTVFGEHAWVQVHYAGSNGRGFQQATFEIADVSHLGEGFEIAERVDPNKADCSGNVWCVENAECYPNWSVLNPARRAVAKMVFEENGGSWLCSGGLLNDNDSSHRVPWFLTANHCIDSEAVANTLETYFQYESPCGTCSATYVDSVLGSDLWATGSTSDFTLLELSELPSSWTLMGWTNAQVLDDVGTQLYRISHPKGKPQAVSQHEVMATSQSNYIMTENVLGTTEGGSSGGILFQANTKVLGQLRGITYSGSYDLCDPSTFNTKDGALSAYWNSVKAYLSPSATSKMHVSNVTAGTKKKNFGFVSLFQGKATVTVVDQLGNVVPRATVTVTFSNGLSGSYIGKTDDAGQVVVLHPNLNPSKPSFTACVSNIVHPYFNTYDSGANTVTCASR